MTLRDRGEGALLLIDSHRHRATPRSSGGLVGQGQPIPIHDATNSEDDVFRSVELDLVRGIRDKDHLFIVTQLSPLFPQTPFPGTLFCLS